MYKRGGTFSMFNPVGISGALKLQKNPIKFKQERQKFQLYSIGEQYRMKIIA